MALFGKSLCSIFLIKWISECMVYPSTVPFGIIKEALLKKFSGIIVEIKVELWYCVYGDGDRESAKCKVQSVSLV